LRLRPERADDLAFRLCLSACSRPDLALLPARRATAHDVAVPPARPWATARIPDARFDIIELDGAAIGRIVVDRAGAACASSTRRWRPSFRNLGIGSAIMRALYGRAGRTPAAAAAPVASSNDAPLRLYGASASVPIENVGGHIELEWRGAGARRERP